VPRSPLSPLEHALGSEIVIQRVAQDPGFAYEQVVMASSPGGPLRRSICTLVAYGEARSRPVGQGGGPCEAVEPGSVAAGQLSRPRSGATH